MKKRRQFLALNGGSRGFCETLVIQARPRTYEGAGEAEGARVGFTITKKVGNAVVRNRIRRRLKAAIVGLAAKAPDALRPDHDYVVIAKRGALLAPFDVLKADLARGLAQAHSGRGGGKGQRGRGQAHVGQAPVKPRGAGPGRSTRR